jgi:hypothetical protein
MGWQDLRYHERQCPGPESLPNDWRCLRGSSSSSRHHHGIRTHLETRHKEHRFTNAIRDRKAKEGRKVQGSSTCCRNLAIGNGRYHRHQKRRRNGQDMTSIQKRSSRRLSHPLWTQIEHSYQYTKEPIGDQRLHRRWRSGSRSRQSRRRHIQYYHSDAWG